MIRNIVFDMGKVVLTFDPDLFIRQAGIEDEADTELIRRELFQSVEWADMDYGRLTEETAEPLVMTRIPDRLRGEVHQLLCHWADRKQTIPGMEALVSRLKQAGYGIYLLSNASVSQHVYWPRFPISRLFDGKLISADVGVIKPMPEIYRLFTDRFALHPEECLFVDDMTANVAAAVHEGWSGVVFHGDAEELERKMKAMGVQF